MSGEDSVIPISFWLHASPVRVRECKTFDGVEASVYCGNEQYLAGRVLNVRRKPVHAEIWLCLRTPLSDSQWPRICVPEVVFVPDISSGAVEIAGRWWKHSQEDPEYLYWMTHRLDMDGKEFPDESPKRAVNEGMTYIEMRKRVQTPGHRPRWMRAER